MKKSFLILLFTSLALTGCNDKGSSDPGTGPGTDPIPSGEYTKIIKLSGDEFSSFAKAAGKQIDNDEYAAQKGQLLTYLQSKTDYSTMVTELDCTKINTAPWDDLAALCIGTGYYLNGKFSQGIFKWTSEVMIYHIEVKARAYTKDNQGTIQVDQPAKIQIDDGEKMPLLNCGETNPTVKSFTADYQEGTKNFTISSYDARVVLQEITITWKA